VSLDLDVACEYLRKHPLPASKILEQMPLEEAAAALESVPTGIAAKVLEYVTASPASQLLMAVSPERAGAWLDALPIEVAARYLRRCGSAAERVLEHASEERRQSLHSMLRYAENTAGALLDPEVMAFAEDLSVRDAQERVRSGADHARYNLYVTDRDDRLVGVFNLRELFLAHPDQKVAEIASPNVMRLRATADASTIISHPGWRRVHALPVVDESGCYLGAIRYVGLRRLQDALAAKPDDGAQTAEALGDVFSLGLSGMLDLLAGAHPK